jgi:D-alanyl-D-alanine carboxypeptidase
VVVLTNEDAVPASADLAKKIAALLLRDADAARQEEQAQAIFADLQHGKIDRSLLTDNCNSYFTEQALKDFGDSLGPLGTPTEFTQESRADRGGMTFRLFEVHFPKKTLQVWERIMPGGKIEQYQVAAK